MVYSIQARPKTVLGRFVKKMHAVSNLQRVGMMPRDLHDIPGVGEGSRHQQQQSAFQNALIPITMSKQTGRFERIWSDRSRALEVSVRSRALEITAEAKTEKLSKGVVALRLRELEALEMHGVALAEIAEAVRALEEM